MDDHLFNDRNIPVILSSYALAMRHNTAQDHRVWQAWAQINFELVAYYDQQLKNSNSGRNRSVKDSMTRQLHQHVVASVHGMPGIIREFFLKEFRIFSVYRSL